MLLLSLLPSNLSLRITRRLLLTVVVAACATVSCRCQAVYFWTTCTACVVVKCEKVERKKDHSHYSRLLLSIGKENQETFFLCEKES